MLLANVTTQHHTKIKWNTIDWQHQYRIVNNLRQRIYRASESGNLKRVRNLQKLMLKATANKLIAIRRVTQQNQGRRSPGVDKVIVRTARAREKLYQTLHSARPGMYSPVKRVYRVVVHPYVMQTTSLCFMKHVKAVKWHERNYNLGWNKED